MIILLRYLKDFAKRSLLFGMRSAKYMDNKRGWSEPKSSLPPDHQQSGIIDPRLRPVSRYRQ